MPPASMDILYSCSLLIALLAGGVAVLLGILAVLRIGPDWLRVAGMSAVALAVLGLVTSVAVHRHWGHGPASAEPMDAARFVSSHPGFLVASIVIVAGLVVLGYARRRRPTA